MGPLAYEAIEWRCRMRWQEARRLDRQADFSQGGKAPGMQQISSGRTLYNAVHTAFMRELYEQKRVNFTTSKVV